MNYKVFFAYQSDINEIYGKKFISEAFDIVISKFKKEKINIELDFGMRKTPGTPLLIEEMLRKSRESDLVIVDMTFTSSKIWADSKCFNILGKEVRILSRMDDKKSPNPNVLLETGYAWAQKGYDRTVLVINDAFGASDQLPVDLQGFRWGIPYTLNDKNYAERKSVRVELANDLYNAIKTAINSEAEYQRKKWQPIRLHKDWTPKDYQTFYNPTIRIKQIIKQLRIDLENTSLPQRIVGPKNSGKTRLAYELYKQISDTLPKHENLEKILYYDLDGGDYNRVEDKLQDLKLLNQRKIVILDNCPSKIHRKVFNEYFYDTNISLLSISNTEDGEGASQFIDTTFANEIIEKLSNETGNPKNTNFIIEQANGNLRNAIVMIGTIPEGESELSKNYFERWKQILGPDLTDKTVLIILEELSLFTHVGFDDRFQNQSDFIIKQSNVESREQFEKIIFKLAEKGIIKMTGDFIMLEAFVEELAFNRLERLANEDLELFFKNITEIGLAKQFSNRLIELNKLKGTHQLINVLSKENGLLTKYNFVNSDQGARIIMSLAELEPLKILSSLEAILKSKSNQELINLEDGRRYLVWALERLVFRKETFKRAAKLLFRLALAENEKISNNATSQFIQLFQSFLPGTQANMDERIELINELVKEPTNLKVISVALDRALMTHGFTRMGGADLQAGEKLQDYQPKNEEVLKYWNDIINILLEIKAYDVIVNRLNTQLYNGNTVAILNAIELILINKKRIDKDLRQQFEYIINDQRDLEDSITKKIQGFLETYSNNTIKEKLEFTIALAPYSAHRLKNGEIINRSEEKALLLTKELSNLNNTEWLNDIDVLLKNEQRLSFFFGKSIADNLKESSIVLEKVVDNLKVVPFEQQNNSFFEGYLSNTSNQFVRESIEAFIKVPEIAYHAIRMTRFLEVEKNDFEKLFPLIESNPNYVIALQYLRINNLTDGEIKNFINWMVNIEPYGRSVAIDICDFNFAKQEVIRPNLKELFVSLLKHKGIFQSEKHHNAFIMHQYVELLRKIGIEALDNDFVAFLTNEIIESSKDLNFNHEYHVKDILEILLTNYWNISWPIIGNNIQKRGFYGWYNLKNLLKKFNFYDPQKLLDWMDKYSNDAPQRVIEFVPLTVKNEGQETWSLLVLEMLNRYSKNEAFLTSLYGTLHSYSWSGSLIPLLESRKNLLEQLLGHSKEEVKKFAEENISYYEDKINREKRNDENESLLY